PPEVALAGVSPPALWLADPSGRNTLNLFNVESSPSPAGFVAESIGKLPAEQVAGQLDRYGVTHVVTVRSMTAPALLVSGRFIERWHRGGLAILELLRTRPVPRPAPDAEHLIATPASDGT